MIRSKLEHVICVACVLFTSISLAQNHFIDINAGYALSSASSTIGIRSVHSPGDSVQKELKGTLGQGHSFALRYGYQFKNHLILECAINRFVGFRYDYQTQLIPSDPSLSDTTTIIYMLESKAFRFTPSIGYQIQAKKNNFYFKAGMVFALPSIRLRERGSYGNGTKTVIETTYNKGLAMGGSIEIGMEHSLNSHLSFLANFQVITMSYAPKRGMVVNYLYNGVDITNELSTYERIVEYHKEIANTDAFDSNSPRQAIRHFEPFSSIGLHLGVRYRFGTELKKH